MVSFWVTDHLKTKSWNLSITGPFKVFVHQCHLHRFPSNCCVWDWKWTWSERAPAGSGSDSPLSFPGGKTAAFQTDLECLCCISITLYQSAVSASRHPAGQPSTAANAVASPLFHPRKAHQEVKRRLCLSGLLSSERGCTNGYLEAAVSNVCIDEVASVVVCCSCQR